MLTEAFLTWPSAGSSLLLPHWLSLAQEVLQEWVNSIEFREKFKKEHDLADGNMCWGSSGVASRP